MGRTERRPDPGSALAEPCDDQCDPDAHLRRPDPLRQGLQGRAVAGHQLAADRADPVALQPAQGRELPRRRAIHRRRRRVLVRPHPPAAGHDADLCQRHQGSEEDRRPHRRPHPRRTAADPAAQHHRLPHHEPLLGGQEQVRQRPGLQGPRGHLRVAQHQRHRSVHHQRLVARPADRDVRQPQVVGQEGRQRRPRQLHPDQGRRDPHRGPALG